MKKIGGIILSACLLFACATAAWAPDGLSGFVFCDVNQNGEIDEGDTPFSGVGILIDGAPTAVPTFTDADGSYYVLDPYLDGAETLSLDLATLPADATFINPSVNEVTENEVTYNNGLQQDWLIGSETCHPTVEQLCWLTAGGVKFEAVTGTLMAQGGPKDTVGGVAYPSCSPFPSNGGQWNHVAHSLKLHLIGQDITVIRCGNVPGIDPGSESPVCPVNFIEFEGTGVVKGIHGNKIEDTPVTFFVRAEDRNEPGNEQSVNSNDGDDIDRYFLRVVDGDGNLMILVDEDGIDDGSVDPLTITGGNFQIHCTSCN